MATFIWTEEFDTLNPYYTNEWFSQVTDQLWDKWAWEFDDKNEPIPVLVKEMPSLDNGDISQDGKTITLKLKDSLTWSDGQPLTSADFVFTWKMVTDPKNTVASVSPYDLIKAIDTPDPATVVMHFDDPYAAWQGLYGTACCPSMSCSRYTIPMAPSTTPNGTANHRRLRTLHVPGLGIGQLRPLRRQPQLRWTKPKIDEIFFRFVPDDASQIASAQE